MGALSSLFQKGREVSRTDSKPAKEPRPIKEPEVGTTIKVYVGGLPLLTGPISALSEEALVVGRQPGQRVLDTCPIGENAYARVLDDLMSYIIRGEVTASTRQTFQMERLRIETFEERRECFRLDVEAPAILYRMEDVELESAIETGKTVNLSADGLCVETAGRYERGDIFRFRLQFDGKPPITIPGRVVRVRELPKGGNQYGVVFHQAGRRDADAIARTLFDIQRARRKANMRDGG